MSVDEVTFFGKVIVAESLYLSDFLRRHRLSKGQHSPLSSSERRV
ncbi:hypothetical protein NMD1_02995 [Novosphingobium sp. MD-1]|nr:hypothetical protein NMD1_02995 [Novosphingobium sp. MD-1]